MQRLQALVQHVSPAAANAADSMSAAAVSANEKPVVVVVSGAAGNIAYSLIFMVAQGVMLGPKQKVELRLLEIPAALKTLEGVAMELKDCAYPLVSKIVCTADYKAAFENADCVLLVGAQPRGPGMERKDLLKANANIFVGQGKALDQYASRSVKVLVVGNPANTNCLVAATNAPGLSKTCFAAMTRLDQNRAESLLSERINCPVTAVKNVIIWGNHSSTQYPDVNHATIEAGNSTAVRAKVNDNAWLNGEFISLVQQRGAAIIKARGKSSAASAASAAVDCMRDWVLGTAPGRFASVGVWSTGNSYGVADGLFYSFPVTHAGGKFTIVPGLKIDEFSRAKMVATQKELLEEKADALGN